MRENARKKRYEYIAKIDKNRGRKFDTERDEIYSRSFFVRVSLKGRKRRFATNTNLSTREIYECASAFLKIAGARGSEHSKTISKCVYARRERNANAFTATVFRRCNQQSVTSKFSLVSISDDDRALVAFRIIKR